jgi:hypothetical protein
MNFNMKNRTIALTSALLFSAASAFAAQDSVVQEQKSLLQKLDSLQESVLGLKLNGTAKAGALASLASSDQFSDDSPTHETQAYTDVNLLLTARPSSETMVTLQLRLHKDWQSAFDENNNPVIGHWFSYDGSILNKHLDFNLGYMRVGYTPLTLFAPQPLLLQEPEIFAQERVETLAQRNLDTTSRRLLQGLNADYHSGQLGIVDDVHAQLTGARLRNTAKKTDQLFFDFDWSDRYFYGGRLGVGIMGAKIGVNYTDVFDRTLSRESHGLEQGDTVYYEDNSILSFELGFDSKKLLPSLPVTFGLDGEFAMSKWEAEMEYFASTKEKAYSVSEGTFVDATGAQTSTVYVRSSMREINTEYKEDVGKDDGKSFYVTPYVSAGIAGIEANLKFTYLQTEEKFWSEMASAPNFRGGAVVLNSNALYSNDIYSAAVGAFGMSSLENLYLSVYNSNPLNATNLMTSQALVNALSNTEESQYLYSKLYNNYKNAHFYRNGYDAGTIKRLELDNALYAIDPSVNMALPFGLATPDRKGFNLSLDATWNDAVTVNAYFGQFKQAAAGIDMATGEEIENTYMEFAVGGSVDIGRLAKLDRKILLQGSYDHAEEDNLWKRKADRIMGGASVDVWGPVALQAGIQLANKDFGEGFWINEAAAITKVEEMFLLAGPRVRIAPNSYLTVQYGMLKDKMNLNTLTVGELDAEGNPTVSQGADELSIDKNVIIADVTVNF